MTGIFVNSPAKTPTILIVEDDLDVRHVLRSGFASAGMRTLEAESGRELLQQLEHETVDLITLDLTLGSDNGLELARQVRNARNIPIVMITAKSELVDRVVGLELGADDYIPKPFHMREVLARVRAVLRRYDSASGLATPAGERYEFEGWVLDLGRRELLNPAGQTCELTTSEFNLLSVLVRRSCRVFTRDEIMDHLKGHEWTPLDRTIDALIARLRRKIEPQNETPRLLKTVRGVGYAFAVEARRV